MAERKVWVLDTETKGTGAEMVPLERVQRRPEPGSRRVWVPPKRRPQPPSEPAPRAPRRFRIVDVVSGETLADGSRLRDTLERLRDVRSSVDVRVYVWEPDDGAWRLLTLSEQQAVWDRAHR
jgi:hypothetical protein